MEDGNHEQEINLLNKENHADSSPSTGSDDTIKKMEGNEQNPVQSCFNTEFSAFRFGKADPSPSPKPSAILPPNRSTTRLVAYEDSDDSEEMDSASNIVEAVKSVGQTAEDSTCTSPDSENGDNFSGCADDPTEKVQNDLDVGHEDAEGSQVIYAGEAKGFYEPAMKFHSVKTYLRLLREKTPQTKLPGVLKDQRAGSFTFLIDCEAFPNPKSLTLDEYRPWSYKDPETKERKNPKWDKKYEDGSLFRLQRTRHPSCPHLQRLIMFLADGNQRGNPPKGAYVVQYIISRMYVELPIAAGLRYTTPEVLDEIGQAVHRRSTAQAKKVLEENGVRANPRSVSYAAAQSPTAVMRSCGPRVATTIEKVAKLCFENPGSENYSRSNADKTPYIRVISVFEDAVKVYANCLPTASALIANQERMERLDQMNEDQRLHFMNLLCKETDDSQSISDLGAFVMVDTTFCVSHLYLTMAIGVIPSFRTNSGKSTTVLLCSMLHSEKDAASHSAFGVKLEECFQRVDAEKRVPLFLSDGEVNLKLLGQGVHFENALFLLCDVHTKSKLIRSFGKLEAHRLWKFLAGTKHDGDVYERGLLGALTKKEYQDDLHRLKEIEPELHAWVSKRPLFDTSSLRRKLEGGFHGQILSTNSLEGKNAALKQIVTRREPAEKLLEVVLAINKDEMKELYLAVCGESTKLHLRAPLDKKWSEMSMEEQNFVLQSLQISPVFNVSQKFSGKVPEWFLKDLDSSQLALLERMKVLSDEEELDTFVVRTKGTSKTAVVHRVSSGVLECAKDLCTRRKNKKITPCIHMVITAIHIGVTEPGELELFWDAFTEAREGESTTSVIRRFIKKADGGKRQGFEASKVNDVRRTSFYANSSPLTGISSPNDGENAEALISDDDEFLPRLPEKPKRGRKHGRLAEHQERNDIPEPRSNRERPVAKKLKFTPSKYLS